MLVRTLFLIALIATIVSISTAPYANERAMPRIFPYDVHVEKLPNGLDVILVPMSSGGLVAYWSIVRTGSRDEYEPGRTGFAHFFEHMMFHGTPQFPREVYGSTLTRIGADTNAYTTDDLTAYHLGFAREDLPIVTELEADRFQHLAYAESDFQTEAGAVYGEYRKNRTNPFFTLYEAIHQTAFEKHTYGHTTMGYERDIAQMPQMFDYSRAFFGRYYRPENVVVLIVGDVDVPSTVELVRRHYGDWKPGYVPPNIENEPPQRAERSIEVSYEGQSLPILWLAYKVDRFDPDDRLVVAGMLLAELAFGETSEIHRKLVLEEQRVEFIQATLGMNRDPGLFDIYTRIKDAGAVDGVRGEIEATIERFQQELIDPQRLADLKSRLKYGFLMGLDTPDRVASALARGIAVTGGIAAVDRLYAMYDQLTPEDVRAAARAYLTTDRRTRGVLRGAK